MHSITQETRGKCQKRVVKYGNTRKIFLKLCGVLAEIKQKSREIRVKSKIDRRRRG